MIDSPRLELVLARSGRKIAIALVLVGVLAIAATGWAVANPVTTTAPQFEEQRVTSDVETSAVITRNTTLWTEGERLTDSPAYMLNESPELTVRPETQIQNTSAGTPIENGTVRHEVVLRFEAVRNDESFWNETRPVLSESTATDNGIATSNATIDVEALRERQRQLEREVGGVGSIELRLEFHTEYETGRHQGAMTTTTPITITDEAYWLGGSLSDSATHSHQSGVTRTTESRSPALIGGLSVLGTLALAGAVIVVRRSPADIDAARRAVHEQRYAEWISQGSIPMWIGDYHVALDTLEDVVDVAIDTNERVVHDTQRDLFAVLSDGVIYYYTERGLWEETAWPEMDLEGQSTVVDADGEFPPDDISELEGIEGIDEIDEFADADDPDGFEDDEEVWNQL